MLSVSLLGVGVAGALARPRGVPAWCIPFAAAVAVLVSGVLGVRPLLDVVEPLRDPVLFLLVAVPLAALLDRRGAFHAAARRLPTRAPGLGLWVLGSVTVALLNLDAAVVLLTPLAVRVARRHGADPVTYALQPALLACLASSALPVSNLTNLVAEEVDRRGPGAFLAALGPPTLVAVVVGFACWRRLPGARADGRAGADGSADLDDRRALVSGGLTIAALAVGFPLSSAVGVDPWVVALLVLVVLASTERAVPWRSVPVGTAVLALSLAVLAGAVASQVDLGRLLGSGRGSAGAAQVLVVGALGANVGNNLPVFLVGLPALPSGDTARWAWLFGVNAGPTLVVTGSLSGLLWMDVARRSGLDVGPADYLQAGLRVGLPALLAASIVLCLTVG